MGARLVGHDLCLEAPRQQRGEQIGGVALQAHAQRATRCLGGFTPRHGVLQRVGDLIEIPRCQPALDPLPVDLHAQRHAAVHRHRQRLGPAHPAEARGQRQGSGQRAAVAPAGDLGEALVGALEDPLAADVDPGAGGHLPVHRQAEVLQAPELIPVGPVGHEVGVGDQDTRGPFVSPEHADGLARLHEQRLVVAQRLQGPHDRVVGLPGAGGPPRAAVDDELVGVLRHLRIEVVHQHPHRRLLGPAQARELTPARGADAHRNPPIEAWTALEQRTGEDQGLGGRQVGGHVDVRSWPGDPFPDRAQRGGGSRSRTQRRTKIERARGAGELDGENPAEVADRASGACGRRPIPSRRDPPASRWSAASRRWPEWPGAGSRPPSPPARSAPASCRS